MRCRSSHVPAAHLREVWVVCPTKPAQPTVQLLLHAPRPASPRRAPRRPDLQHKPFQNSKVDSKVETKAEVKAEGVGDMGVVEEDLQVSFQMGGRTVIECGSYQEKRVCVDRTCKQYFLVDNSNAQVGKKYWTPSSLPRRILWLAGSDEAKGMAGQEVAAAKQEVEGEAEGESTGRGMCAPTNFALFANSDKAGVRPWARARGRAGVRGRVRAGGRCLSLWTVHAHPPAPVLAPASDGAGEDPRAFLEGHVHVLRGVIHGRPGGVPHPLRGEERQE